MKRPIVTAVFLLAVTLLAGCPIYSHDDGGCFVNADCAPQFACDRSSGLCYLPGDLNCSRPSDCDPTATCTPNYQCQVGDCSFYGCVNGYVCDKSQGIWQCLPGGAGGSGGAGAAGASEGGAAGAVTAGGQAGMTAVTSGGAGGVAGGG